MTGRGEQIPRPRPWLARAADRRAFQGWQQVLTTAPENLDRAWVAITSNPRHIDQRQQPLKGALGVVKIAGSGLEQWQYEVTGGGRTWYAIDDGNRTLWITRAGAGIQNRPTHADVDIVQPFVTSFSVAVSQHLPHHPHPPQTSARMTRQRIPTGCGATRR